MNVLDWSSGKLEGMEAGKEWRGTGGHALGLEDLGIVPKLRKKWKLFFRID